MTTPASADKAGLRAPRPRCSMPAVPGTSSRCGDKTEMAQGGLAVGRRGRGMCR